MSGRVRQLHPPEEISERKRPWGCRTLIVKNRPRIVRSKWKMLRMETFFICSLLLLMKFFGLFVFFLIARIFLRFIQDSSRLVWHSWILSRFFRYDDWLEDWYCVGFGNGYATSRQSDGVDKRLRNPTCSRPALGQSNASETGGHEIQSIPQPGNKNKKRVDERKWILWRFLCRSFWSNVSRLFLVSIEHLYFERFGNRWAGSQQIVLRSKWKVARPAVYESARRPQQQTNRAFVKNDI